MTAHCAPVTPSTHPLYFIEIRGLNVRGRWFLEYDRDETRADVLDTIRLYRSQVIKVLEVIEDEGTCRDVTAEMLHEAQQREDAINEIAWENHCADMS